MGKVKHDHGNTHWCPKLYIFNWKGLRVLKVYGCACLQVEIVRTDIINSVSKCLDDVRGTTAFICMIARIIVRITSRQIW